MAALDASFLSCLSGSEALDDGAGRRSGFLSCLSGSEVCDTGTVGNANFLSCLSGSEVVWCPPKLLIFKR